MTATYHDTVYELGLLNVRIVLWRGSLWWKLRSLLPFVTHDDLGSGWIPGSYWTAGIGPLWIQWWSE